MTAVRAATLPDACNEPPANLESALAALAGAAAQFCAVTMPAPLGDAEELFGLSGDQPGIYLARGSEPTEVGWGVAASLESPSPTLGALRPAGQRLLSQVESARVDADPVKPRLFGGRAFGGKRFTHPSWVPFPPAWLVLPRYRYRRCGGSATLTLTVERQEIAGTAGRHALLEEARHILGSISRRGTRQGETPAVSPALCTPTLPDWVTLVREAGQAIAAGTLTKVVLARSQELDFAEPPQVTTTLSRLAALSHDSTRFAWRRGSTTFLGASPERLVLRRASEIRTDALAGSTEALPGAEARLLASAKDRLEHGLVVDELLCRFAMLGARVSPTSDTTTRRLRHLVHLHTPLVATMSQPPHVLDLTDIFHPTPAVGGIPDGQARLFIEQREPIDRGWYASPVGWCDADGDGEFVVALRSGLITDRHVTLFAGAGIVEGSLAESEWEETSLKFAQLLEALGLGTSSTRNMAAS